MKKLSLVLPLALTTLLFSCGGNKAAKEASDDIDTTAYVVPEDTTPVTVNEEIKFKFDFAIANIPSPVAMVNDMSSWGVDYNSGLLNDTKKSSSYSDEFEKSVTLGIYNIDMSYAMVNNQGQDVMKYMKTVLVQSDNLGLKGAVDRMIGKRAESNLSNKDSLLTILSDIFVKSDSYLRTNARVYTASCVFAGSWIEGLYLTCKIAEGVSNPEAKAKAYKTVWDQRFYLKNLIDLLEDYKDKKESVALNNDFKVIHKEVDAIKDAKDINDAKFKDISEKIYALRDKVTK
ncbi:MAG TPA: hypothetical protein VN026_09405 [Bacteroidia bacterium]|jgi:hypothetical protein|nr:hypothetical protein [Bacteroidia bacterium]